MKTKKLAIVGVLAVAMLLGMGAGTANCQTPGGNDSQAAQLFILQIYTQSQTALAVASSSGSPEEIVAAYDLFVVAQLTFLFYVDLYIASGSGSEVGFTYFTQTQGIAAVIPQLADVVIGTGNPLGESILALAQQLNTTLASAVSNDD